MSSLVPVSGAADEQCPPVPDQPAFPVRAPQYHGLRSALRRTPDDGAGPLLRFVYTDNDGALVSRAGPVAPRALDGPGPKPTSDTGLRAPSPSRPLHVHRR